jgi:hypothetical protein
MRLTVGHRALQKGGIEAKLRHETEKRLIPQDEIVVKVKETIDTLYDEIEGNLAQVEFDS